MTASAPDASRLRYGLAVALLVVGVVGYVSSGEDGAAQAELAATAEAEEAQAAVEAARADAATARDAELAAAERAAEAEARAEAEAVAAAAEREAAERAAAGEAAEVAAAAAAEETAALIAATWTVTNVVDGDTVDVRHADGTTERVRVVGIDTPERGECGFGEASAALSALVLGEVVQLVAGARDDRDRYDRILRYVDVDGVDAGLTLIERGLAIARYDSRDGYGRHDREDAYVAADRASDSSCTAPAPKAEPAPAAPSPSSGPGSRPDGAWKNCTEARDHGAAPVHRGDPGYGSHLDRDNDGIGCE